MKSVLPQEYAPEGAAPTEMNSEKSRNRHDLVKAVLLATLLAASLAVVRFSPLGDYLDTSRLGRLRDTLASFRSLAPLVFLGAGALLITMGAPRSIISILGGMAFGFSGGTLLSLGAALLGSVVIFWLAKWLGRPLFRQKIGRRLKAVEGHIENNGFLVVALLRQLPLTCMLVNVLIGLSSVTTGVFILGSIIGLLPEAAIFALFGSSVREGFVLRVSMGSVLLILLILAVRTYYRKSALARDLSQKLTGDKA